MEKRYIDPETFNREDVKYLTTIIVDKFNEFLDSVRDLEFMLEESPNKFKYLDLDCRYIISEMEETFKKSSLLDDVEELFDEEEENDEA